MSRVAIVVEVDDEYADPDHDTGLTTPGYEALVLALTGSGVVTSVDTVDAAT